MDKLQEKMDKLQECAIRLGAQVGNSNCRTKEDALRFMVLAGFHRALWQQNHLLLVEVIRASEGGLI